MKCLLCREARKQLTNQAELNNISVEDVLVEVRQMLAGQVELVEEIFSIGATRRLARSVLAGIRDSRMAA